MDKMINKDKDEQEKKNTYLNLTQIILSSTMTYFKTKL